jgi:hypothetical protein
MRTWCSLLKKIQLKPQLAKISKRFLVSKKVSLLYANFLCIVEPIEKVSLKLNFVEL